VLASICANACANALGRERVEELQLAVYRAGGVSHGIDPEVQEDIHDVGIEPAPGLSGCRHEAQPS
jgi:hypothetical protein